MGFPQSCKKGKSLKNEKESSARDENGNERLKFGIEGLRQLWAWEKESQSLRKEHCW